MGTQSDFRVKKNLIVGDGTISSESGNLVLRRDFDDTTYNQITLGDDTYKITLDNSDRFYIDGGGQVGIGTTSPVSKAHIEKTAYDFDSSPADGDFHLMLKATETSTAGDALSIGFAQTSDGTTVGAKISHLVSGSFSRGHLVFSTNNTASTGDTTEERMRITNVGNVGIGTTSPGTPLAANAKGLVVAGTGGIVDNAQDGTERIPTLVLYDTVTDYGSNTATVGEARGSIEFYSSETSNNYPGIAASIKAINESTYNSAMGLGLFTSNNLATATEKVRIDADGNVGIGTTSPSVPFHVAGGNNEAARFEGSANDAFIKILEPTGSENVVLGSTGGTGFVGSASNNNFAIRANNSNKMTITPAGNVGIGYTSPAASLDIRSGSQYTNTYKSHLSLVDTQTAYDGTNPGGAVIFGGIDDSSSGTSWWAKIAGEKANTTDDNRSGILNFYTRKEGGNPTSRMIIDEDGYVGIGTTAPNTALVVRTDNDSNFPQVKIDNAGSGDAALFFSGGSVWSIGVDNSDSDKFKISQDDSNAYLHVNTRLAMTTAGYVGLGTASPGYALDIQQADAKINLKDTSDTDDMLVRFEGSDGNEYGVVGYEGTSVFKIESPQGRVINLGGHANVKVGVTTADMTFTPSALFHVNGALKATTKSFDIEHPTKEGMRLHHGVLEGPEHGVYIRGHQVGETIELPDYWLGLVDEDTITVQLTAKGRTQNLYVKSVDREKVVVGGFITKAPDFYYFIQAERKDVDKMEVEYAKLD